MNDASNNKQNNYGKVVCGILFFCADGGKLLSVSAFSVSRPVNGEYESDTESVFQYFYLPYGDLHFSWHYCRGCL